MSLSTRISNHEKNLSNKKSIQILNIIGSFEKPITPREIEEQWIEKFKIHGLRKNERRDSDVYRVIHQLAGFSISKKLKMFYLDEIEENADKDFKLKLLKKINILFNLRLKKNEIDTIANKLAMKKEQKGSSKDFIFSYREYKDDIISIIIEINNNESKGAITIKTNLKKMKHPLELKKDSDRVIVSAKINLKGKGHFINYDLQDNKQKEINELQQKRKLVPELSIIKEKGMDYVFTEDITKEESSKIKQITDIQFNVSNYAYFLSFKGFIFYLQNERTLSKINKVLENLIKNEYTNRDYAFLVHPDSLDKLLGKNIRVKILKLIVSWFSDKILFYNGLSEAELKYFISSFYFWIIHNLILEKNWPIPGYYRHIIGNEDFMKLKDYRIDNLRKIISYQEQELAASREELKRIENEGIFPPSYVH